MKASSHIFKTIVAMIQRVEGRRQVIASSQIKTSEEHETHALDVKNLKPHFKKFQNSRSKEREAEEKKM
jgi:hypothetical protein